MSKKPEFSFGDSSVANAYDTVLVPTLFDPWAEALAEQFQPWEARKVLDLASGTGIVAQKLSKLVGPDGRVTAADINPPMLAFAKDRCKDSTPAVEFVESPAAPLNLPDASFDIVVCQQGFQFFPDSKTAAEEIYRVLKANGQVVITTWCPVSECDFFGAFCEAFDLVGEIELAEMMRVPFDLLDGNDLPAIFTAAGFENIELKKQSIDLLIKGGDQAIIEMAYATPVGPKLKELPESK